MDLHFFLLKVLPKYKKSLVVKSIPPCSYIEYTQQPCCAICFIWYSFCSRQNFVVCQTNQKSAITIILIIRRNSRKVCFSRISSHNPNDCNYTFLISLTMNKVRSDAKWIWKVSNTTKILFNCTIFINQLLCVSTKLNELKPWIHKKNWSNNIQNCRLNVHNLFCERSMNVHGIKTRVE